MCVRVCVCACVCAQYGRYGGYRPPVLLFLHDLLLQTVQPLLERGDPTRHPAVVDRAVHLKRDTVAGALDGRRQ